MLRTLIISAVSGAALTFSVTAFAGGQGPEEAKAMLQKAVAAVKADQTLALIMFVKGEGGFLEGDLYPFCFRIADGKALATPKAVKAGSDIKSLKDSDGNSYGLELYAAGQKPEGEITEIKNYKFPKPGTTEPMFSKISFVTKVGELACGVGYYK